MRRYVIPVTAAVAFGLAAGPALAAPQLMTGDIESFDAEAGTFSLQTGVEFQLAEGVEAPDLTVGEDVEFLWDYDGDRRVVTEINHLEGVTPKLR